MMKAALEELPLFRKTANRKVISGSKDPYRAYTMQEILRNSSPKMQSRIEVILSKQASRRYIER
jgi:hypothetical protein